MSYWFSLKTGEAVGHVPTMTVSPWSLRVTTTAYGLASTMEMLETLFPGITTSLSALWIGIETPILVTVPCTSGEAGGTMPVPTPTSMVCGIVVATTVAATRTVSTGPSFVVGLTLSRRRPC